MVADDPTKCDATGLPVQANPPAGDEAEAGPFVPQRPEPDQVQAGSEGNALTPKNSVDDSAMSVEADELVPETESIEMEQVEGDGEPDAVDPGIAELDESAESGGPAELGEPAEARGSAEAEEPSAPDAGEVTEEDGEAPAVKEWYILKVQVNREDSIRAALLRRIKIEGLEELFDEIVVPTEEVAEFNKSGKRKIVRKKIYPGYILVHMVVNDDTWFLVRETPGVGDFTGSSGKPTPMDGRDVERILRLGVAQEDRGGQIKTAIPFKVSDRVRVKDGHFQNFEGEVDSIDEANGRITVMINIFNRSTPVELEHWQVESV